MVERAWIFVVKQDHGAEGVNDLSRPLWKGEVSEHLDSVLIAAQYDKQSIVEPSR